jgi:Skp family chaperone for outer membrane proteins
MGDEKMKKVLIVILIFISCNSFAQKGQRIAYVDMNYILENIPEYVAAQSRLDSKVKGWQLKLDVLTNEINTLKTDLSNEKPLLTNELIQEREEDILIKEKELKRLQMAFFGPTGDLFQMRKQLAKPIQDQVYNSIQTISANKRFDIVFDKSSDLIMLYTNKKYDISELVLNSIVKNRKRKAVEDRKIERLAAVDGTEPEDPESQNIDSTEAVEENVESEEEPVSEQKTKEQQKIDDRFAKREALKAKIKAQQEARIRVRDSLRKVANADREAKLKEIEERKKAREEKIENNN